MFKIKSNLILLILFAVVISGCDGLFDTGDAEKVYDDVPQVEFAPLSVNVNLGSASSATIKVQLIGPQRSSDISVSIGVEASSTVGEGGFTAPATVTIPANTSSANVVVNFNRPNVPTGSSVLRLSLTSASDGIKIAPNLKTTTFFITNPAS